MPGLLSDKSFMKYFKNTGWLFLEKGVRIAVTLTVWALVIRYLGPQQFGVFSYALSYVFLFGMLADCGMDVVLVKDLVERPTQGPVIMGSAFVLRFLGATAACVLIVFSFFILVTEPLTKVMIALMALRLFFAAFDNIESFFQSRVLSKYPVYAQLMSLVSTSILCVAFVLNHKPLVYFVWVVVLEAAVAAAVFLFFYRRIHGDRWIFNAAVMGNLLSRSWPLVVSGFAIAIYMRLDQLMIKHMLGDAALGQYAVAVRVSEVFYFIPMAMTASLFPAIVQAKMKGPQVYHDRLKALNALLIWIALVITAAFSIWGRGLIGFFFGSDYTPAAGVLMIHIWASVFVFLGVLRSKWAINEHAQNLVMVYTVLGAVINVALNLIWIPAWGIQGAALATVMAQCFATTLSNLLHPKTRPMFFMQMQAFNPVYLMRERWQG